MPDTSPIAELPKSALARIGRTTTRRGALAWSARAALGLVGITAGIAATSPAKAGHGCGACASNPSYCGIYGRRCSTAACGSGGVAICPTGSTPSGSWWSCCKLSSNPDSWGMFEYRDCCQPSGTQCGDICHCHPSPQFTWCQGNGAYRCTITIYWGACP